ncbi:diacylglycerol kinase [Vibrio sinensis]|uniref:Diacylglycerol kinase n=1 Tax=Vibrio sinensis TaxID=2302434 RepID=A0A3A6QC30_9VIBR|nr:diacylglycerol kinase [Vibrio sinensis]RJX64935.1 diacylglycerol kinase [Vibrio sinensis]
MTQKAVHGVKRLLNATKYSYQGLKAAFRNEAAFREEVLAAVVLIPLACYFDVSQNERILLIGSVILVMVVELLNSAIETTVDRIGSERHELSGRAKDIGSAAVLLTMILAGYIWLEILWI